MTTRIEAEIIADSVSPDGVRLTTQLVTYNRFIISEVNTHRKKSRNSASSRAISFEKMLHRARHDPAPFIKYVSEQPGMSGGLELEGNDLADGLQVLLDIQVNTVRTLEEYLAEHPDKSTRLHKSILNRTLEWFGWTTTVISSTEWDNFFEQRCHPTAQPEFQALALKMRTALDSSEPEELEWFGWHKPFIGGVHGQGRPEDLELTLPKQLCVSAARCARTSYLTHDGDFSHEADLRLFRDTLMMFGHLSPLEHPAICLPPSDAVGRRHKHLGNFDPPWHQLRHMMTKNGELRSF